MSIADKLTTIAENVSKVYQAGYDKGVAEGGDEAVFQQGYEAGKTAEWNAMWDAIQRGGMKAQYKACFQGEYWTKDTFKPKYNIVPSEADNMFSDSFSNEPEPVDLTEILNNAGVTLDFSQATSIMTAFYKANIKRLPVLNFTSITNINATFRFCKVETIDGLILKDDGTNVFNITFASCEKLREIAFIQGVIGNNIAFDNSSFLSKQTIIRVINALSGTTTGKACTFNKSAVNNAFETAEGLADGSTSSEWLALVATKPNWTISLK